MACIVKIPTSSSKGVVTFTTQERDKFILNNVALQNRIKLLKDRWIFGLHHNWHDFKFNYNSIFDFSMAGETDLIEVNQKTVPLLTLDACNFSPSDFHYSQNEKFWDILYVGRAVNFKKIPDFFKMIRKLYDKGLMYRVLLIAPIPDECKGTNPSPTVFCKIRDEYDKLFTEKEKDIFTLLTTVYRNPFPFDIPTVSQFYKLSKVFVHSADEERRCRVAGYAWACGMPVVSMDSVASLMPKNKQYKPFCYIAKEYNDFPTLIQEAVEYVDGKEYSKESMEKAIEETSELFTQVRLKKELSKYCGEVSEDTTYALENLDIRLGRHHGFGEDPNSVGWSIKSFLNYLENREINDMKKDITHDDPERYITKFQKYGKLEKDTLHINNDIITLKSILIYFYNKYEFLQKLRKWLKI